MPETRASMLRRKWLDRAYNTAGIDAAHWQPACGVDVNRRTIERVYDYYGGLYLRHVRLEWAGMANMIGPSFYAGFLDIGFIPDLMRRLLQDVRRLVFAGRRGLARILRRDSDVEEFVGGLGFFETTFLTMQRKIFEDQALMHEAYLGGGIDAIRELGSAGILDSATIEAWEQIDGGDATRVHAGNRMLLFREQHDIIDRFYVDMLAYAPPLGRVFTYLLTLGGSPAIPRAKGYCDVFPLTVAVPLSRRIRLALRTPLAAGNIALFTDRWKLIDENTLPVFQRLITDRTAEARMLIAQPISQRVGRFRLLRRAERIVRALLTHWRLGAVAAQPATRDVAGDPVTIDLTAPPRRTDTRSWSNARRRPFLVTLLLPDGRTFSSEAALVVLLSTSGGGDPTRLTVKLPATSFEDTRETLLRLAPEWEIDRRDIAAWEAGAAATTGGHAYATHVLQAQPIGFIRPEIQIEHHAGDGAYVIDALFSWDASEVSTTS